MNISNFNSSVSGYVMGGLEGICSKFTEIEVLTQTEHHILARAKRFGRWWMLKALTPDKREVSVYQQMQHKELEILMHLQHPYIEQAVGMELVEELGMCIIVEYVDGVQLNEWLDQPHGKSCRLKLAEELLEAVEYMHKTGTVHRDLKPANILVTRNGENIKLIDFGLADNDHIAILKQPAGTPNYMSPEQASIAIPDVRNDIYSVGVILQRLLPERNFHAVIKKCFLPIDKRYQNVSQLALAIQKQQLRSRKVLMAGLGFLILLLLIALGIQTYKLQEFNQRRVEIDLSITLGMEKVDAAYLNTGIDERLDTCTRYAYIASDIQKHFTDGANAVYAYLDSITPYFTDIEMFEIMNALHMYNGSKLKRWNDVMNVLITKEMKKSDEEATLQ